MGVQFAYPEAVVACVTGEGSFMMICKSSQHAQYGLPVKLLPKQSSIGHGEAMARQPTVEGTLAVPIVTLCPISKRLLKRSGIMELRLSSSIIEAPPRSFSKEMRDKLVFVDVWVDRRTRIPTSVRGIPWQTWFSQEMKRSQNDEAYYFGSLRE